MSEEKAKARGVVDLVFLMDITGSMQRCIDELRNNIGLFIDALTSTDSNESSPVKDWRGKVVGYRDVEVDGNNWYVDNPFVRDPVSLKSQLAALKADGGGDEPESLLEAIHSVASMPEQTKGEQAEDANKWRYRSAAARVVVIFTDATFKEPMRLPELKGGGINDINHIVTSKRIILSIFAPDMECYNRLCEIDKCEWEPIPYDKADTHGAQKALAQFTSNKESFKNTLRQLAASVSKSAEVPAL